MLPDRRRFLLAAAALPASVALPAPAARRALDVRSLGARGHSGVALEVHPTARRAITGNRFVDCGWSDGRPSAVIDTSAEPPGEMRLEGNAIGEPRAGERT